jgi:ATP-binding cassette subfamily B protein
MIRAHWAERSFRNQHTKLLGSWANAALRLQKTVVQIELLQTAAMFGSAVWLLVGHPLQGSEIGRVLLVIYWGLTLPGYGEEICRIARTAPYYRNLTLRLLDPLRAPEEENVLDPKPLEAAPSIQFRDISITASGHQILRAVDLEIESGAHVAIVGPSGAGKSSLLGLLFGWWKASGGAIEVNGRALDAASVRQSSVWIDPSVHLWNRSLFSNVSYGNNAGASEIGQAIDSALLRRVLESLPDGLQTKLGEGGGLVSGGESQRVRVARAMANPNARLAILDEPFRGLDAEKRSELLKNARRQWRNCTLLCVTHDMRETLEFDKVIVVENGTVIEQGEPRELARRADSRYAQLLRAEAQAGAALWSSDKWRRIRVQSGRLIETIDETRTTDSPDAAKSAEFPLLSGATSGGLCASKQQAKVA